MIHQKILIDTIPLQRYILTLRGGSTLSEKIEGYVIEGEKGSFLDGGNRWREVPVREAHVHEASAIEEIREAFHYCRNKPRQMYQALCLSGVTFVTGPPISFYVVSGGSQPFVGDCAQLTT